MEKQEFVLNQEVDESTASKAWDIAEGNEDQAREMLREQVLWLKGKFSSTSDPVVGVFLAGFDLDKESVITVKGVVLSTKDDVEVSVKDDRNRFDKNLESLASHPKKMNANTNQLTSIVKDSLTDASSGLRRKISESNVQEIDQELTEKFSRVFDFKVKSIRADVEMERPVDSKQIPTDTSEEGEEEAVEMPCDIEVSPVGIPVASLQPGDDLFVTIVDVDRSDKNIKRRLEAGADPETGMIKARLVSKKASKAGTMNLRVKFSDGVFGKISSGKDVSIRVPTSTQQKRQNAGSNQTIEFLKANSIAVGTAVIVVILLVILVIVLTG